MQTYAAIIYKACSLKSFSSSFHINISFFTGSIRRGLSLGSTPGVLLSSGQTWVEMRRTSLHTLRDFGFGKSIVEDAIDEEIENLLAHIDANYLNQPIDVGRFFNISVLASLWRVISGESMKIGDPKLEGLIKIMEGFLKELGSSLVTMSFNYVPLYNLLNKIGLISFQEINNQLFMFNESVFKKLKDSDVDSDNPLNFTEALIAKIQETKDPNSPFYGDRGELNLVNVLIDLFIGGSDTSSTTLNWTMLYMILNPEVQNKVRDELKSNVGPFKRPKMEERHLTPYTEAVIHEVQRMGNILPMAVFHYTTDEIQVGPYKVPKDTILIPMIGEVLTDAKNFPNPNKFQPERYLDVDEATKEMKFKPNPKVIPFGTGKRRCMGELLARVTLYKFTTAIIQKYEIVSGQDEPILEDAIPGFARIPVPYKLIFKPRDK